MVRKQVSYSLEVVGPLEGSAPLMARMRSTILFHQLIDDFVIDADLEPPIYPAIAAFIQDGEKVAACIWADCGPSYSSFFVGSCSDSHGQSLCKQLVHWYFRAANQIVDDYCLDSGETGLADIETILAALGFEQGSEHSGAWRRNAFTEDELIDLLPEVLGHL